MDSERIKIALEFVTNIYIIMNIISRTFSMLAGVGQCDGGPLSVRPPSLTRGGSAVAISQL